MKYFLILLLAAIAFSCKNNCTEIDGVVIGEGIRISSDEQNIEYCNLVEQSLNKDLNALKTISLLNYQNSIGYEHGTVLVEIVDKVGEMFIHQLLRISLHLKSKRYLSYLDVGIEYSGDEHLEKKNLKLVFPDLYQFLTL
jgi:hypothetical protein